MPEYDDDTLEQIMREGLEFRAGSAATSLAGPPGRDRHVVRRGRGRWVALAAAAAVVVADGTTFSALHGSGSQEGQVAVDPGSVPSDWRYESYDGVQVRVPPSWGWGGEPTGSGDSLTACGGPTAAVAPGSDSEPPADTPFVGRPVMMSDACQAGEGALTWPQTSAVWLGSPLPVGTDTSGDQVAATVAVGSQHVTVFAADDALRAQILSTAESVEVDGNGCPTAPVASPVAGPVHEGSPLGLSVCVYGQGGLLWSTDKEAGAAQDYVSAFSQVSAASDFAEVCPLKASEQWVAIGVGYGDAPTRWDIADFECMALVGSYTYGAQGKEGRHEAAMVPATVEPWAGGGTRAYVVGPGLVGADDPLAGFFRGVLG